MKIAHPRHCTYCFVRIPWHVLVVDNRDYCDLGCYRNKGRTKRPKVK